MHKIDTTANTTQSNTRYVNLIINLQKSYPLTHVPSSLPMRGVVGAFLGGRPPRLPPRRPRPGVLVLVAVLLSPASTLALDS